MPDSPDKISPVTETPVGSPTAEASAVKAPTETMAKSAHTDAAADRPATAASRPQNSAANKATAVQSVERKAAVAHSPAEPSKPVASKKPVARSKPALKPAEVKAARRSARVAKAALRPHPAKVIAPQATVNELKEKIMSTKNTDFAQPVTEVFGELQTRAKAAYEKGTEVATEVTEFTKGNVEAIVESSKIFASGAQSLGKTYVEEAKSAYETITADVKELAAVRSPAELFQLQGKIMRRNFDSLVATSSKNGEAVVKLANDAFAPFTGRVNVAAEKLSKVA